MKKKIIFLMLLLLTSFNYVNAQEKYSRETSMSVDQSGNVKFEVILKANTDFFDKYDKTRDDLFNLDSYNISLQSKDYLVDYLFTNDGSGITIDKTFPDITKISSNKKIVVDLTDITSEKYDDSSLFQIKRGLFSNKYIGNFIFDYSKIKGTDDVDINEIRNVVTSKYTISLPNKSKINNASEISSDNKTLSWNLRIGYKNDVNFEFEETNIVPIIIFSVIGIIFLIFIIAVIVKLISKKIVEMDDLKIGKEKIPKPKKIKKNKKVYNNGFEEICANENKTINNEEINNAHIMTSINNTDIQSNVVDKTVNENSNTFIPKPTVNENPNTFIPKPTEIINNNPKTPNYTNDIFNKKPVNAPNDIPQSPDYTGVFNPKIDDFNNDKKD